MAVVLSLLRLQSVRQKVAYVCELHGLVTSQLDPVCSILTHL